MITRNASTDEVSPRQSPGIAPWIALSAMAASLLVLACSVRADVIQVVPAGNSLAITLPVMPTSPVTMRLFVFDADVADEGIMKVNGHPVSLFGDAGLPANNQEQAWITYVLPAADWQSGVNTVTFAYTRREDAYRVDLVQVAYQVPDMALVQLFKSTGRAPPWLTENDDVRVRLRRNPDRVYMCSRENGAANGRTWTVWTPGDQIVPDMSQPLQPITACDKVFCFAADDSSSTRSEKILQACGN